ncbi:type 4b pilus protein PilO2 [Bordetella sp. FB-8]|uniref:type 4b pilus protein PilO2 n=1 Tax=Bordetella sp. FB-8 TaxID=1159870 RepID=UPI000369C6E3|nr:type 4b pilus protein PilO2 [Bordetella sp. FB-8]
MRLIPRQARSNARTVYKTVNGVTPFKIGRRLFVSGLDWQVLPNGGNYQAEARRIAKREREETGKPVEAVFVRRQPDVVQAGFVVRGARARRGMVPLAAVAADVLGPSFVAAFEVSPQMYAVTGAMHDVILPGSDKCLDKVQARAHFQKLWESMESALGVDAFEVYAPEGFFSDAEPYSLEELARGVKRSHRLRKRLSLAPRDVSRYFIWAVVLGTIFGGAGILISNHLAKLRLAELESEAAANRLKNAGATAEELARTHPWAQESLPGVFADRCTKSLGVLPVTLGGWPLSEAHCSASQVTATYARTQGRTVNDIIRAAQAWDRALRISVDKSGDLVTIAWGMAMPAAGDEILPLMRGQEDNFMSHWQHRLISFTLTPVASSFPSGYIAPKTSSDARLMHPSWKTLKWDIKEIARNPINLMDAMSIPGVRVESESLSFSDTGMVNWSMSGKLYGQ